VTVHRDIKSANIVLDEVYNARLTDFGLARDIGATTNMTSRPAGTVAYMAPWAKGNEISPKLDIFALGVGKFVCVLG